jgi:hypothetical protein
VVDVVRAKLSRQAFRRALPQGRSAGFSLFNLKGKSRCRLAAGAPGCNMTDNHKSQDLRSGDADQ